VKIERATLRELPLTLVEPFRSSAGVVRDRRVLLLTVESGGLVGWGECVALGDPTYTYETTDTAWQILTHTVLPRAVGGEVGGEEPVLSCVAAVRGHPMAKAALEMATQDLLARAADVSLATALGGSRDTVPVGVSLGMSSSPEQLCDDIARHVEHGYERVKVKIGPGRDLRFLAAARERFPDLTLWADANSAYSLGDAPLLAELDELGLGMIEEPLTPGDFVGYARLRERVSTPVCLDESIMTEQDAAVAIELRSCDVVNLKPGRLGGHAAACRIHDALEAAGVGAWVGGMLESGVGRAHLVAFASREGLSWPGDISASRRYWVRDIVSPEFEVDGGRMAVPTGAGIGVDVDVERVEALTVRSFELS